MLKRFLPHRAKWLKSIIAFANGAGEELIFGVDDKSRDIVRIEIFYDKDALESTDCGMREGLSNE